MPKIPDQKELQRRVENAVRVNLSHEPKCMTVTEVEADRIEREGYWERAYIVAWHRRRPVPSGIGVYDDYGTHRVCVNSNDEAMLVWGHYDLSLTQALSDAKERVGG